MITGRPYGTPQIDSTLLLLGVPERIADAITGWEPGRAARMRARYLHVTDPMLKKVAEQVGDALWHTSATPATGEPVGPGGEGSDPN